MYFVESPELETTCSPLVCIYVVVQFLFTFVFVYGVDNEYKTKENKIKLNQGQN